MAYYIISHDPESMGHFQERFEFLKNARWITDIQFLKQLLPSGEIPYFFISLSQFNPEIDNKVIWIKEQIKDSKIIYVYDSSTVKDIELHQHSPFGGDIYVDIRESQQSFFKHLESVGLTAVEMVGNKLETPVPGMVNIIDEKELSGFKNHPISNELNLFFKSNNKQRARLQTMTSFKAPVIGEDMSDKDQELSLDNLVELEVSDELPPETPQEELGLELSLDLESEIDLTNEVPDIAPEEEGIEIAGLEFDADLNENTETDSMPGNELSLSDDSNDDLSELNLSDEVDEIGLADDGEASLLDMPINDSGSSTEDELNDIFVQSSVGDELLETSLAESDQSIDQDLSFSDQDNPQEDLSDDALEKLKEIDEIMVHDASQASMNYRPEDLESLKNDSSELADEMDLQADIDQPLVSDDLNLDSIDFPVEEPLAVVEEKEVKKKKSKENREEYVSANSQMSSKPKTVNQELQEISGAYSGEMERMQATISNLREDREELLNKIQKLEDEKMMYSRQNLSLRAELDEKKIELTIVRKKLNEDLNELKDRLRIQDEKKLIQEERFKQMKSELDKVDQKNKLDLRKVQLREKELEQKLELLKADAETQIRNRDLKILDLKRKIDTMEFDMESISSQEKRSVESRFELEDKLDKAIKTLRSAISVLEDESDKTSALEALKKNIEM